MTLAQTLIATVLVALYAGVIVAAIRNPDLIPLATIITPVVLLPVGYVFPKAIRDLFQKDDTKQGDPPDANA